MTHSGGHTGGHRVRSVARWVATPILLAAAALVGYANVAGSTELLRISSVGALAASVGAVVLFDTQLVRARRSHGEERAALARSYAATYAAHIRVTDPGSPAEWSPVSDRAPRPWPAAESAPTVSVGSGSTPAPRTVTAQPVSPAVTAYAAEHRSEAPTDARPTDVPPVDTPPVDTPPSDIPPSDARPGDDGDMWDAIEDAPTVVDMIAWEERARVGIVDADGNAREAGTDDAPDADGTAASDDSAPPRARDDASRGTRGPARTEPAGTTWEGDAPTDDPRRHAHGPRDARSA